MLSAFDYIRPDSIQDAIKHLAAPGARAHAGGTDLLTCLRDRVFDVSKVVSLNGIQGLRGIVESPAGLRIGALTTIAEVAENPSVKKYFPGLSQAASEVASPQLRNQGTIGGNLCQKPRCWYYRGEFHCTRKGGTKCFAIGGENQFHAIFGGVRCIIVHPSDTAPALTALEARLQVVGPRGTRLIPMDAFFVPPEVDPTRETVLEPGELVTEIQIPAPPAGLGSAYRKVRARRSWDFALAGVALALVFDGPTVKAARVVLSGAAPVPWRSRETEEAIVGKALDESTIAQAAEAVVSGARPRSGNEYKIDLFKGVMTEQLSAAAR